MRTSAFPLNTLKEIPNDAEIISHQLMLRAGLMRRVASGIYTWMPLGLKVLRKVEHIVREEMDRAGALEVLMPSVQPAELWEESGRWAHFGPELLRFKDRHLREYCLGPTHEEVITDMARREIKSYRQLPLNYYQIQWKFRDEVRPRFGVMRSREFLMKDAYSFHLDKACLEQTYLAMYTAYSAIFDRLQLKYRAVIADSGAIGGSRSQEFHVLADSGEDAIAFSDQSDYAANIEMTEALAPTYSRAVASMPLTEIATPQVHTIDELVAFLKCDKTATIKTLLVKGKHNEVVALCVRGDHELNTVKVEKLPQVAVPLTFASAAEVKAATGADIGSVGPIGLTIPVIADHAVLVMADFICGANRTGFHSTGVNWERDVAQPIAADIRNVVVGDPSPDGQGSINIARGIEVGHIFQLGSKYSEAMNATVLNEAGQPQVMQMGCYGIGVSRIVAAAIEQNYDERGIIWPDAMAPFNVVLVPMNYHKSPQVKEVTDALYNSLKAARIDVLLEDRDVRAGMAFADHELLGIPHRLVIGERGLALAQLEYKGRRDSAAQMIAQTDVLAFIQAKIASSH